MTDAMSPTERIAQGLRELYEHEEPVYEYDLHDLNLEAIEDDPELLDDFGPTTRIAYGFLQREAADDQDDDQDQEFE